jgi:hypothetical protein
MQFYISSAKIKINTVLISLFTFFAFLSKVLAQSSPIPIIIKCDPCSLQNKEYVFTPKFLDLKKGQSYIFSFQDLNNAYYYANINAQSLKKTFDLPAILQTIIPTVATTQRNSNVQPLNFPVAVPPLYLQAKKDYLALRSILDVGENMIEQIPTNINPTLSKAIGQSSFIKIQKLLADIGLPVFDSIDVNKILNAKNGEQLQPFVNSLLIDFQSNYYVIKRAEPLSQDLSTVIIFKYHDDIETNKTVIINVCKAVAIVQTSHNSIESDPYHITGDYLRLNVSLFGNRFSGNPDTLLQTQIDFYRVHYWQFDISSGFFLNNLVSKSYYFTDSLKDFKSESGRTIDLSVGALLHLNYVFSSALKSGPVIGAGVSFLDGKTRYFGGWGFMIGRNNEFALSVGAALASLPEPSNAIVSAKYGSSAPSSSVPTYDQLNWKGFLSVTYCFTNKTK